MQYQSVLSEALKDTEIDLEVSNGHMFENKLARHDAMNSLASHYYQMYEFERQRVPASSLDDENQSGDGQTGERQGQHGDMAQRYRKNAQALSDELQRQLLNIQGRITWCFSSL